MNYVPKIGDKVVVANDTTLGDVYGDGYVGYITRVDPDFTCKVDDKFGGWLEFDSVELFKEEHKMQDEISLQNVKFDMKAIAEEIGVSLEKAHNIVQTALFEKGVEWFNGKTTPYATFSEVLSVDAQNKLWWDTKELSPDYEEMSIKVQCSFYMKEEKPETIEFNGKQYNKEDVAKALALLSPIN